MVDDSIAAIDFVAIIRRRFAVCQSIVYVSCREISLTTFSDVVKYAVLVYLAASTVSETKA